MEKVLAKARKALDQYKSDTGGDDVTLLKSLVAALDAGGKYIAAHDDPTHRNAAKLARLFDEILDALPEFRSAGDRGLPHLHGARQADEHLQKIRGHLAPLLMERQDRQRKQIKEWLKCDVVLDDLWQAAAETLPDKTYVLLFCDADDGSLKIVTRTAEDDADRIFTRFRPQDLNSGAKLHRLFHEQPRVRGAAFIADKELVKTLGELPRPAEGEEQLKYLRVLSGKAVDWPFQTFLDGSPVLSQLHKLAGRRKLPKTGYVLLFQKPEGQDPEAEPELVVKSADDEKVITRFHPAEFADKRKLKDRFSARPPITGAAVFAGDELAKSLGELPEPGEEESLFESLQRLSSQALEQPSLDFLAANEVLGRLHALAQAGADQRQEVILFVRDKEGKLGPLAHGGHSKRAGVRIPLYEFRGVWKLHKRFAAGPEIVGASVIGLEPYRQDSRPGQSPESSRPHRTSRGEDPGRRPVVVASFGTTPLKEGVIASPDMLRRLGLKV